MSIMWGCCMFGVIALAALRQCRADTFAFPPFEELSLCLPFNIQISTPAGANRAYSVSVIGEQALVAVVTARWASASTSFGDLSPVINGALFVYAQTGSIPASSTPLQIIVYIPQLTLRVVDVTRGTIVTLPRGFQMSPSEGTLNVPAGAILYAPQVAIPGRVALRTEAHTPPYSSDGLLVWTNARSSEHLQAVSIVGPAEIVVNTSSEGAGYQTFATQPYGALSQHWTGTYANISLKADEGTIAHHIKASLRDIYVFEIPCQAQCPYRYFVCTFDGGCTNVSSTQSLSYDYYQTIPIPAPGARTPFKGCPLGIPSFTCNAGATSQKC